MSLLLWSRSMTVVDSDSPLGFETAGDESWPVWYRYLTIHGKRAYELGNVCSTCAFFFERMDGANDKAEVNELITRLAQGLATDEQDAVARIANMVPQGDYVVNMLEVTPSAVTVGTEDDYFISEQQETWGSNFFGGTPHDPKVPYYRSGTRVIGATEKLFEFLIPMYPRSWLNQEQIDNYRKAVASGLKPTAVSVSLLDVKGPAFAEPGANPESGGWEHWCLAHYILDGHHKIEAAAQEHGTLTLLSFLAIQHGVSSADQVTRAKTFLNFR